MLSADVLRNKAPLDLSREQVSEALRSAVPVDSIIQANLTNPRVDDARGLKLRCVFEIKSELRALTIDAERCEITMHCYPGGQLIATVTARDSSVDLNRFSSTGVTRVGCILVLVTPWSENGAVET